MSKKKDKIMASGCLGQDTREQKGNVSFGGAEKE